MRLDHTTVISDHVRPSPGEAARQLTPGSLLAGRYRLVGPVGSGGMGVVYRAEDLKIGQPVALKFIPPAVADDPELVARLVAEVRVGRQVAHPNVCRLYDIVESDGQHFMAMELVDGEDLSSLLRRVGRLPVAKALDVARDICLGLAAAHDLTIVHRDLKPANIMIDGRGRARITDFGLAASAAESSRHRGISGTPGYMSPEQARGEPVTTAADIYALGIVLYEIFTGRQAFHALSSAELIAMNAAGVPPAAPSTIVPDIDPDVEWTILQCLQADPAKRPASARQVLESLPARDVLEAAVAAGETPLPEVVAAAGARGNLRTPIAALLVAVTLLGTAVGVALRHGSDRDRLLRQLKSPDTLRDRSAELAARLAPAGSADADEYFGYMPNETLVASLADVPGADRWKPLVERPQDAMLFWYRRGVANAPSYYRTVAFDDPPHLEPGSVSLVVDGAGRLRRFRRVPGSDAAAKPVNWQTWFADAGLDARAFAPAAAPRVGLPAVPADRIEAWQSRELLVVAGTRGGVPVFFDVLTPAERAAAAATAAELDVVGAAFGTLLALIAAGAFVLARRNLNRGRVDRRGAWVLALFVFVTFTVSWLMSASVAKALEGVAYGVLAAVVAWLAYVALEPFVRRRWPATLVGWSRLVQRRPGDPHVGRDILIGLAAAAASRVLVSLAALALERSGTPDTAPTNLRILPTARAAASELFYDLFLAVLIALCFLFLLYAITLVVRRRSLAVAAVCLVLLLLFAVDGGVAVIGIVVAVLVIDRFGLLAGIATMYGSFLQAEIITFDLDRWYAGPSMMAMAILAGLTVGTALRASPSAVGRRP